MSSIERLSIQGIRSFGANAGDAQVIRFESPITLILGENGCGKTTIIECLKFALTGEFPPGSDKGKNFIHDPKVSSLSDALGQVKLEVRNIQGNRLSISRSIKVGMKRGKVTFETLDATLNYLDSGGVGGDSISKRSADVNLVMSRFMGVSKAIINNVLFCHQEDSSWPLDEPKKLKEKFDAIFGIAEYDKALDRIIKMRKEEITILKIKESELKFAERMKKQMEEKTLELESYHEKAKCLENQCIQCDEEMKPIEKSLQEIFTIESEIGTFQAQKIKLETEQKNCQEQVKSLQKKIKQPFKGSLEDLDKEILLFKEHQMVKNRMKRDCENKLNVLHNTIIVIESKRNDMEKKYVLLQQQQQKEDDCKKNMADMIKVLCSRINVSNVSNIDLAEDANGVADLLESIQVALEGEDRNIKEAIAQNDCNDQEKQKTIDQLRVDITKLKEALGALRKQKLEYECEVDKNNKKIMETENATKQLKTITDKLIEVDGLYEETLERFQQQQLKEFINHEKEQIKILDETYQQIDEKLTFLNSISKLVTEVQLKERELNKREQEVRRVKLKHNDDFQKLFDRPVEEQFKRHLQSASEKFKSQVKQFNEKLHELKLKEQSCEMKRKVLKDDIQKLKADLEDGNEKIYEKCRDTSYEELLMKSKAAVNSWQLELGAQKSAEVLYKKYLQQIGDESQPYCPLCHKNMSGDETLKLSADLNDEIQQLPSNIKKAEEHLKLEQKKYENLLHLKPTIERVNKLRIEIPQKEVELKSLSKQLSKYATEMEELQLLSAEPAFNMELANTIIGDMSLLDEAIKDVTYLKSDIEKLKAKLPQDGDGDSNISIDEMQEKKQNLSKDLKELRQQLDGHQKTYERQMDALNKLRELKNNLKDQQIKLQEGIQSLPQLHERQEQVNQQLVKLKDDILKEQTKLPPMQEELDKKIIEKAKLKETQRIKISEMQSKLEKDRRHFHDVQKLYKELDEYGKLNLKQGIQMTDNCLSTCKEQLKNHNGEKQKINEELQNITKEIMNQENTNRDLRDNRELKLLEDKSHDLSLQYQALGEQLDRLNFNNMVKEKGQLHAKRDQITVRKGELQGQRGEINHNIKKLEKELNEPDYRNALMNYRRIYYEVEISRRVYNDLGQHRIALEWALMQFHTEKMKEINRLIREYWRLIYRGNDIDYIEIQTNNNSDDDMKKAMNTNATDKRRSYNYRVVQSKNNSVIEMRGRCSAGQRVLASLIIRMALAETFSSNCGVLALDEPTTNLDRSNIQSLCAALNRVVEQRKAQSNFMLIIITHDETFITSLCKVDKYHYVTRNDECKSEIKRVGA